MRDWEGPFPLGMRLMRRSSLLLSYDGRVCQRHRCRERLVGTDECVDCIGAPRLRGMHARAERQAFQRRVRRLLYELSDGGKTTIELVHTAGFPAADVKRLLGWLESRGIVRLTEERIGRHSRSLWSTRSDVRPASWSQ